MEVVEQEPHKDNIHWRSLSLGVKGHFCRHGNMVQEALSVLSRVGLHAIHCPVYRVIAGVDKPASQVRVTWMEWGESKNSRIATYTQYPHV